MSEIYLIGTRHEELGRCTSQALSSILEQLKPEVIFEELPSTKFEDYYTLYTVYTLESLAVRTYTSNNPTVKQLLVDSLDIPTESFFKDYEELIRRVEGGVNNASFNFRNFSDRNRLYIFDYGFNYLNSKAAITIQDEMNEAIVEALSLMNNEKLILTWEEWNRINRLREQTMIQNIYEYSSTNSFNRGVFLIGSAHRKPIIEHISSLHEESTNTLNWIFNLFGE